MDITNLVTPGIWIGCLVAILILLRVANIFRYISNNQVGIVEKMWAVKGSIQSGFIALHGEAGFEPEILRGGVHVFFPFTYRLHKSDLVTVGQGQIAYVFARDGASLEASQVLAANDTVAPLSTDQLLHAALSHFATHGLSAAARARDNAASAFFADDRLEHHHWMAICRLLDRRMAAEQRECAALQG